MASFSDGTHSTTAAVAADGRFSVDLSAFAGSVTSTLSITDAAGNTASVTGNAVTVDTLAYQSLFGTLVHDAGTALGQVVELYLGLLGRAPDAAGIETWSRALANGATVGQIAEGFLASGEYTSLHGPAVAESNAGFVAELYAVVLGRPGDAAGTSHWLDALAHGTSRAQVALAFATSPENVAQDAAVLSAGVFVPDHVAGDVARLYYGILDRGPDMAGLQGWTAAVKAGASELSVAQALLASQEYQTAHAGLSDAAFVADLYDGALGRSPDAGGLATWQAALGAGQSRAAVAFSIAESPEAKAYLLPAIELGWHVVA